MRRVVREVVEEDESVGSFHDLRLLGGEERFRVVFDVVGRPDAGEIDVQDLKRAIERRLREKFPRVLVLVEVEPPYFQTGAEEVSIRRPR